MERHELDPFSLVFGAVFALLGVAFLVARPDVASLRWVWPIPILALGALIVGLATRGDGRRAKRSEPRRIDDAGDRSGDD